MFGVASLGPLVGGAAPEGGVDCAAAGVPAAGSWPHAGIASKAIARTGIAKDKIGRSRFIQVVGVGVRKENCSVSRGIPARSCEYPKFLGCTNRPADGSPEAIFVAIKSLTRHGSHGSSRIDQNRFLGLSVVIREIRGVLSPQNGASIDVEDLTGDESCKFRAQE